MSNVLEAMKIKLFADGADKSSMLEMAGKPYIQGFTTNPTLMYKAGIRDYEAFARDILTHITDLPISFEVLSDDFAEMERQALKIASWGNHVYVKIPVMNTKGEPSYELIRKLAKQGVKQNITALMLLEQVHHVKEALGNEIPAYVSIFAGRIADTGIDPLPLMKDAINLLSQNQKLIWASSRELLNIFQAESINCPIITVTDNLLKKIPYIQKDLYTLSQETIQMFLTDAKTAGFSLK